MSVKKEFKNTKSLILHVLEKHEETRNSDTKLYIQCCRELGATTLEELENINLNIITIHKIRQVIQNKENRFLPIEIVKKVRAEREGAIREYMQRYSF